MIRKMRPKQKHDFLIKKNVYFRTENKLKSHGKLSKNKIFCEIVIPSQKDKIS